MGTNGAAAVADELADAFGGGEAANNVYDPDDPNAALEAARAGGDDSDDAILRSCVPESFDFFEVNAGRLREVRDSGNDPRIARVRFKRYVGAKRVGLVGEYDASMVNSAWLIEKQPESAHDWAGGPGRYEIGCLNESGNYVTGKSVDVGTGAAAPSPAPAFGQPRRATTAAHWQGAYAQPAPAASITDQILTVAMERLLNPPPPPPDPMKDTVSTMLKMMQLQQTQALEQLRVQAQIAAKPSGGDDLTKILLGELLNQKRSSPMDGMREMLDGFMAFRALMGSGEAGAVDPADPPPHWIKILDSAINEMGPGVTSLAAHAILGDEGAASIDEMIKKQMETREAEAKADAATINVPGVGSDDP
jgi:hypothetical protein